MTDPTYLINCLTNDKLSDCSKLRAFADGKIRKTQKFYFESGKTVENNIGK